MQTAFLGAMTVVVLVGCGGVADDSLSAQDATPDNTTIDGGGDVTTADANSPCGANEVFCGNACYPNDFNHCGPSCVQCGAPENGTATCVANVCGFTCGNLLQCGSTCIDSTSDDKNCGACGHDCLGTPCSASACVPQNLYPVSGRFALAGDANNLYWLTSTGVYQAPKIGGNVTTLYADPGALMALPLALDANNVYFATNTSNAAIGYVPIGGGNFVSLATGTPTTSNATIDSNFLYYGMMSSSQSLWQVPLDAGTQANIADLNIVGYLTAVARNGAYLYVTWSTPDYAGFVGRLRVAQPDAGVETLFVADASATSVPTLTFDDAGANVYFGSGSTLFDLPLDGGAATVMGSGADEAAWVTMDDAYVYWAAGSGGNYELYRTKLGTTTTTTVTSGSVGGITGIYVDATYLYWIYQAGNNGPNSGIYRVAK